MAPKANYTNCLLLVIITFCAHFLYFREFTLYEDDFSHIASNFDISASELLKTLYYFFIEWPQGRPIHFSIPAVATFAAMRLGGLDALYLFAYSIVATNVLLSYSLIKKVAPPAAALAGALAFCLFPADTNKGFLTYAFCLQPALTFLLASSICYLNGRTFTALILLLGCMLTYETTLLPILAVPLLATPWSYNDIKIKYGNFKIILIALVVIILYRIISGESRILVLLNENIFQVASKSLITTIYGTATAFYSLFYRIITSLKNLNLISLAVITTFILFIYMVFAKNIMFESRQFIHGVWTILMRKNIKINMRYSVPAELKNALQLFTAGLVAVILAYPLTFTHWSVTVLHGNTTRAHLAATFGVSICVAALAWISIIFFASLNIRKVLSLLIALYFSSIIGFHINVQNSFRNAAAIQAEFWHDILRECPDVEDGTLVFILWPDRDWNLYIMPWCTPYVFEKLYAFPESWKSPPNVYVLDNEPERHNIFKENGQWFYREPWQGGKTLTLVPENTILLVYNNNEMQRHFNSTELISINDTINFKAVQASRTVDYERRKLYNYLLERKSAFHY